MSTQLPMPGLETFTIVPAINGKHIGEEVATIRSASAIIKWGARGWDLADAFRSELQTWRDGCACTDKSKIDVLNLRFRVAELEAFIIRNSDPYDMNEIDTAIFHEIGKRLVPQNY